MSKALSAAVLVLSLAGATQAAEPSLYAKHAREVTEHIQKNFFDAQSGVYFKSATVRKPDYVWLQSVMFSNLVAAARSEPDTYGPLLQKYFTALDGYWDAKVKIPGYEAAPTRGNGNDKYYDDNAWLVITFLEAYETNRDPHYRTRADETLKFVLSGWDEEGGGGIWWHQGHKDGTKNACANGPAAVGCLRLAKFREGGDAAALVEQARKIVAWTVSALQAEDGLIDDRKVVASGEVKRGKLTYNSALVLRALLGLYRTTGKKEYLEQAQRIAKAADWFLDRKTGVYRDAVRYGHFMVEADLELYRTSKEEYLLKRAKKNVDAIYESWKAKPPDDMISNAAIARVLWLMAETETDAGRAFWQRADKVGKPFEWQAATPESEGLSKEKLDALKDELAKRKTHAFLVIRNDKIVYEWYAAGYGPDKKHGTASLSKATVAGLALALLANDRKLKLDTPVADLVAVWKDDPSKRKITLRHLGSHTSGLADAEQDRLPHDELTGWKGDFWKQLDPPDDPFTLARDKTPLLFEPGAKLQYSNPGIAMLCYALTAALAGEPQKDLRSLLRDRLMRPIGVADEEWSVGYSKTYKVDGLPLVAGWGGGGYTPRAMARVGRLLLREGDWDDKQILSKEAVQEITGDAGLPGHCGMGFWTNADGRYAKLPKDTYYGAGAGDQLLIVVPSRNLIVVRFGEALAPEPKDAKDVFEAFHDQRVKILFEPLLDAITDSPKQAAAAPYPPSQLIKSIAWEPKETIVRKAHDSDNWPLTWADDGHQYTAYGDGYGFEPFVPKKLGLGFARVEGEPTDFKGVNVRSPSGEQSGNGAKSKKASGILCVEGVLYLWTRNAGNAQLAWSKDHGETWAWADWKLTTSFGCPTFLNFGKDYAGARDEWVYLYSPDAESAYQPADRMVLARVPKGKIAERTAYEFFKGFDEKQRPLWSKEVADRTAVFTHKGRCYRSGITFNAGLKRYLWVQIIPGTEGQKADTSFEGGFAIYDAPEPWGPWTTVYFTEKWDVGPGETASFPTKWVSGDGKALYLVFSGDDNFAIRKASLTVATAEKSPPK